MISLCSRGRSLPSISVLPTSRLPPISSAPSSSTLTSLKATWILLFPVPLPALTLETRSFPDRMIFPAPPATNPSLSSSAYVLLAPLLGCCCCSSSSSDDSSEGIGAPFGSFPLRYLCAWGFCTSGVGPGAISAIRGLAIVGRDQDGVRLCNGVYGGPEELKRGRGGAHDELAIGQTRVRVTSPHRQLWPPHLTSCRLAASWKSLLPSSWLWLVDTSLSNRTDLE